LTNIFNSINGLLIPGGGTELLQKYEKMKQEARMKKQQDEDLSSLENTNEF